MPLYEYKCPCGRVFEELQTMRDPAPQCPTCEGQGAVKQIAGTQFQLKGQGWAKDGYAKG